MEETTAYTAASPDENAVQDSSGISAAGAVLAGITAIALMYAVTSFLPKIAAAVDKVLGRESKNKSLPEDNADGYKVWDIYEGELNIEDKNKKE